jgi:hypothetical protein
MRKTKRPAKKGGKIIKYSFINQNEDKELQEKMKKLKEQEEEEESKMQQDFAVSNLII